MIDSATKCIPKWGTNDWKTYDNKPVKNRIEFEKLKEALEPLELLWNHVPSHQENEGNEEADRLAREGIDKESPIILPAASEIDKEVPGSIVLDAPVPVFDSESSEEENYQDAKDPSLCRITKDSIGAI